MEIFFSPSIDVTISSSMPFDYSWVRDWCIDAIGKIGLSLPGRCCRFCKARVWSGGRFRPFSTQLRVAGSGSAVIPHRESRLEPKDRAQSGHTGEERIPRAMMLGAIGPCTSEPTVQDA